MSSIFNSNDNDNDSNNHIDTSLIWIYHERQNALLCGQHALNNLVQDPNGFTISELSIIAQQLDTLELHYLSQNNEGGIYSKDYQQRQAEGSYHIDNSGNFSIEVLKVALQKNYNIILSHLTKNDLQIRKNNSHNNTTSTIGKGNTHINTTVVSDITDYQGFVCHKSDHWFTIRKVGGRFWNMNSTLERPIVISHFKLATDLEQYWTIGGYTIFCVPTGLPECGKKPSIVNTNWHRMIDLLNGKSTDINTVKDPWENVGSGMRLDNNTNKKNSTSNKSDTTHPLNTMSTIIPNGIQIDELSEEEQLRLALQLSLGTSDATISNGTKTDSNQSTTTTNGGTSTGNGSSTSSLLSLSDIHNLLLVPVPDEPQDGVDGVIKIRFRLPNSNNKMIIRRFNLSDTVGVVYSFVVNTIADTSTSQKTTTLELLYGYPPKDLLMTLIEEHSNKKDQQQSIKLITIEQAKLANESVQCRIR